MLDITSTQTSQLQHQSCSTWYVDDHSQHTEEKVVKRKVEGIWQIYAPHVGLPDVWQGKPDHSHLTGNAKRVQEDEC